MYAYVEWVDSVHTRATWAKAAEIDTSLSIIKSIGYVVKENKESVTLACSHGDGDYLGIITIPKVAIKKRKVVRI